MINIVLPEKERITYYCVTKIYQNGTQNSRMVNNWDTIICNLLIIGFLNNRKKKMSAFSNLEQADLIDQNP